MGIIENALTDRRETFLYVVFGGVTVLVSWGLYSIFVLLGMDEFVSKILSSAFGIFFAFVVNKWYVFLSRSTKKTTVLKELWSFFGFRIFTILLGIGIFRFLFYWAGLNQGLFGISGLPANIIASIIEIGLNYLISKYIIFKKRPAPADADVKE
ncbi:MAG: GtrA family protein [Methanomassiliicoccaceae archaeon]|jgi:putative flippase GtrA|nr:GtrA family protein [Methanomassiliicoccaceae archaeon]